MVAASKLSGGALADECSVFAAEIVDLPGADDSPVFGRGMRDLPRAAFVEGSAVFAAGVRDLPRRVLADDASSVFGTGMRDLPRVA